mgnify:CR=1 FL=1
MFNYSNFPYNNAYGGFNGNQYNYIPNSQNGLQGQINGSILKVSGINGVNALNLAPNTSVLALDETAPIVWLVSADGAGYKTPTPYDITPHKDQQAAMQSNFEERLTRLEQIVNDKSDIKSNAKRKSDSTD